jgi:mRNA-degrading endonuclease YafQ of YafQ-DinJ toxin-antitoxin module
MKPSGNTDAFEKKLKRLMNRLESERQALNKILMSVGNDNKLNQSNK